MRPNQHIQARASTARPVCQLAVLKRVLSCTLPDSHLLRVRYRKSTDQVKSLTSDIPTLFMQPLHDFNEFGRLRLHG